MAEATEKKTLLEVIDLHTFFTTRRGIVKAVNNTSYSVREGETLGIVGESGSGKSVSAMSILRLLDGNGYIDSGKILFDGRDLTKISTEEMYEVRGNEISVIFQEPMTSLNPVFTIEKQISEVFMVHQHMSKEEAAKKSVEILRDVKIPNPEIVVKQYPHQLSGGMRQRVMIAMALACRPKLLIADEPTTALDVTIQAQILRLIKEIKEKQNMSVMLITHDLGVIAQTCDRVIVMYGAEIVEQAPVRPLYKNPLHPYTRGLLTSIPKMDEDVERLNVIEGMVPNPLDLPPGCRFCARCGKAQERCKTEKPALREAAPGRFVACHYPYEVQTNE